MLRTNTNTLHSMLEALMEEALQSDKTEIHDPSHEIWLEMHELIKTNVTELAMMLPNTVGSLGPVVSFIENGVKFEFDLKRHGYLATRIKLDILDIAYLKRQKEEAEDDNNNVTPNYIYLSPKIIEDAIQVRREENKISKKLQSCSYEILEHFRALLSDNERKVGLRLINKELGRRAELYYKDCI